MHYACAERQTILRLRHIKLFPGEGFPFGDFWLSTWWTGSPHPRREKDSVQGASPSLKGTGKPLVSGPPSSPACSLGGLLSSLPE